MSSSPLKLPRTGPGRSEPQGSGPPPADRDVAARLIEFARACRTAARAVSLYPDAHPTIRVSLDRLSNAAEQATAGGPLSLTVLPDSLALAGSGGPVGDSSASELAALLHSHHVGAMTIHGGADVDAWRTFLLLLARSPEEVKSEGGINRVSTAAGTRHVELREIDYAEVLKERSARSATWEDIVSNCLQGEATDWNEDARRALVEIAGDVTRLTDLASLIEERTASSGGLATRTTALLQMLRGVVDDVSRAEPDRLEPVLQNMAAAISSLSVDTVLNLLKHRQEGDGDKSGDLMSAIRERMTDESIARFVARAVTEDRGASARLVEAFQTLVPDSGQQHRLLQLAQGEAARSPLGADEGFEALWESVADMLTSYSDIKYVSAEYARELSGARAQALEVEQVTDDPPERVAAWLATVSDAGVRALDLQVLLDLLSVESDPGHWRDMTSPVLAHIEDLLLVGDFTSAKLLADALLHEAGDAGRPVLGPIARQAVDRLVQGPLMRHIVSHLHAIDDAQFDQVQALCQAFGPVLIQPLAEALAAEDRERPRQRLTELFIRFGSLGRRSVEQLKNSPNAAVRRTAIYLLREFGGSEALPDLASLLDDVESHVQREAIRAIVAIATDQAYAVLERALASGTASSRDAIMQALGSIRDERASPLFSYIVSHVDHRGPLRSVYVRAIEALGALRDEESVDVLKQALYRGEWYAPLRSSALRLAAAAALGRIGTPRAIDALQEAAGHGSRGVRTAARTQLTRRHA